MAEEKDDLLALLNAHGQDFLSSFASSSSSSKKREAVHATDSARPKKRARSESSNDSDEEEEWTGFGAGMDGLEEDSNGSELGEEDDDEEGVEDDGYTAGGNLNEPQVVIFSDSRNTAEARLQRPQSKAFMSSKVSKLRSADTPGASSAARESGDAGDERTHAQNDAALHKLVHTKLLSGSLDPALNFTSAQRKKALAGRVLELAGSAKLGKGEKAVRSKEHARASKHVRDGIEEKRIERKGKALAETKEMGNWHPTIKKLFADEQETARPRKREKGLGMGVGKFENGMLKLSRREIFSVNGPSGSSSYRGGGRGRGRGRGRGGGKR